MVAAAVYAMRLARWLGEGRMDQQTILCYTLSTIAQVAAALAALLAFLVLLWLNRLQDEANKAERALAVFARLSPPGRLDVGTSSELLQRDIFSEEFYIASGHGVMRAWQITTQPEPEVDPLMKALVAPVYNRWRDLMARQRWLIRRLALFLTVTLILILAPAIGGLLYVNQLATWAGTQWWVYGASAWLGFLPAYTMWQVAKYMEKATRRHGPLTIT
jgi:hypothetical protein